jgi:DNA-binding IclR family transcriptional regulator
MWNRISETMTSTGAQAVDRAARLLTCVVEADAPISFTELCEASGLARSTTSRLLAALESNALLQRDDDGGYSSGSLFAIYAARHDPWSQLVRAAHPLLERLRDDTGETANLAAPRGETVVQIAQVDSHYVLGARDWTQVTVPAHVSATGKVLYAYDRLMVPNGPLEKPTRRAVGTSKALQRQLAEIRRRGYATTSEELEIGLNAVAAPVHGPGGAVIAAVGVSGPSARLRDLDAAGRLVSSCGDELSQLLRSRIRTEGVA